MDSVLFCLQLTGLFDILIQTSEWVLRAFYLYILFLSQILRYFYKSSKKEFCEVSHFVRMCYNLFHLKISFYFWTHFQLNVSMQTLYEGKTCSILTAYSTVNVLIILPLTRPISYLIPIHITRYCNLHMYAHAIKNQNVQILNLFT